MYEDTQFLLKISLLLRCHGFSFFSCVFKQKGLSKAFLMWKTSVWIYLVAMHASFLPICIKWYVMRMSIPCHLITVVAGFCYSDYLVSPLAGGVNGPL